MKRLSDKQITEMVKEFFDMPINMDTNVLANTKNYADRMGVPLWLCIQNILISYFARKQARVMVEGANPHRVVPEFVREVLDDDTKRVMTGEELFDYLLKIYMQGESNES